MITPKFITDDGREFDDESAAQEHEAFLAQMEPIARYEAALKKAGWDGSALSGKVNAAKLYLTWHINGAIPKPAKAKEKPADKKPAPKETASKKG